MENFEYSILLNDRDWAEFDLDSDECSLIPPALAKAEDQVLSDLEEGEVEENRLVQARASPLPAHEAAKCLSRGASDTQLLAEDIWPGMEDETHLASVNSGIKSQAGALLSPSDGAREQQLSCASSESLQSPGGPAGLDADREVAVAFNAMEGESDTGCPSGCPSEVVAGSPFQEEDVQEQGLGYQSAEGPTPAGYMSLDATERMENPTEGKGNAHLSLKLQLPKNETVSMEVLFPTSIESTVVSENAEGSTYCPPEDPSVFQAVVAREAIPFQEKPSMLQERSVPARNAIAWSHPPSESHRESPPEKESHGTEKALDLQDEKGDEGTKDVSCHLVQERGQADYGRCSACVEVEHPFLAGREGNVDLNATQGADPRCNRALDKHRETVVLAEIAEKSSGREPWRRFEMEVPVDQETYPVITGGERPELGEPSILCGLTLEDAPESSFTDLTWPEMYDHFFCDNTKEEGGETRRDGCSAPCTARELPDMYGPEMYEYFFNEMDIEKEGHRDNASETFLGLDPQSTLQGGLEDPSSKVAADTVHISTPEVYEHFFANGAKDRRNWRGFLLRLTATEAKKAARALKSFLSRPVRRLRSQPTSHGALLRRSSQGRLVLLSPRILDERPETGGTAVVQPERPLALQPVLTQRDMCLGFVAFASWAVKTSDLQAPDAWKIVLLANFGTLSAIRYFRRQVVMERWHDT